MDAWNSHPDCRVQRSYIPFPQRGPSVSQVWAHPTSFTGGGVARCRDLNFLFAFQKTLLSSSSASVRLVSPSLSPAEGMSRCAENLRAFLAQVEAKAGQEKGQLAEEFQVSGPL